MIIFQLINYLINFENENTVVPRLTTMIGT